jgi:hypothetical protein
LKASKEQFTCHVTASYLSFYSYVWVLSINDIEGQIETALKLSTIRPTSRISQDEKALFPLPDQKLVAPFCCYMGHPKCPRLQVCNLLRVSEAPTG